MNTRADRGQTSFVSGVAVCIIAALIAGCELNGDSTTSEVTISPSSVSLNADTVSITEFTATGGTSSNYTWSLSNDSLGTLYAANATVLYQNTTNIGTNTLTVLDGDSNFASARITQR